MRPKKFRRFFDRHFHDVADRLFIVEHFERLWIVTATTAVLTRHQRLRQKIHLQLDHALTFAVFATATLGIE